MPIGPHGGEMVYYNLETKRTNPRDYFGTPEGRIRYRKPFDQNVICDKYKQVSEGAQFGVCKALVVQWIKRQWKREGFWDEWITSTNPQKRKEAETTILQMSRDEVLGRDVMFNVESMRGRSDPNLVGDLVHAKKDWAKRYFRTNGLIVTPGPSGACDDNTLLAAIGQVRGYNLLSIENEGGIGHCIGLFVASLPQSSRMFDPNFGEYNIPGGFDSWDEFAPCLISDYTILFRLNNVGKPTRFLLESLSR